jgi:hypothetical protein
VTSSDYLTISKEEFFDPKSGDLLAKADILYCLFKEKTNLEVELCDDSFTIRVSEITSQLTLSGSFVSGLFDQTQVIASGFFAPLFLSFERISIPHSSFLTSRPATSAGNFILGTVYQHLVRELPVILKETDGSEDILPLNYFYLLRFYFPNSFEKSPGEFAALMKHLSMGTGEWQDPILNRHADEFRKRKNESQNDVVKKLIKDRLLGLRSRLMEVI